MSVNGMIGAGIFALPALLYAEVGNFAPWIFLIFGILFAAGTLISTVPEMRAMVDARCSADKETRVFSVAASVIFPFVQAALTDPDIR